MSLIDALSISADRVGMYVARIQMDGTSRARVRTLVVPRFMTKVRAFRLQASRCFRS